MLPECAGILVKLARRAESKSSVQPTSQKIGVNESDIQVGGPPIIENEASAPWKFLAAFEAGFLGRYKACLFQRSSQTT